MKILKNNINIFSVIMMAAAVMLFLQSCEKRGDDLKLNALPNVNFEVLPGADANTVILVNKTSGPSIPFWHISTGQKLTGDSARLRLIFAGDYEVKLVAAAQGGLDSVSRTINIANSDPNACNPANPIGFIAGCTQKTWKLNPDAGALMVGEWAGGGNWWTSVAADVAGRSCAFNDEYTFHFNAEGTFEFDNKGDFYGDGYLGNASHGCEPTANLPAAQKPWGSNTFSFSVLDGGGVAGLGQLRVNGTGAHIGLPKAYNGGETTTAPVGNSITYDILEMQQNVGGAGYDLLKIAVNIGGSAWWTFTLRSF